MRIHQKRSSAKFVNRPAASKMGQPSYFIALCAERLTLTPFMPLNALAITPLIDPLALNSLAIEANAEGHSIVARLQHEWATGENGFDLPGERSYVATLDGRICGVCGLNIDPFAGDNRVGRVRRLYVSPTARRRGVGSLIMNHLVRDAAGWFDDLHLRTYDSNASAFYIAAGFSLVAAVEHCTHKHSVIPQTAPPHTEN